LASQRLCSGSTLAPPPSPPSCPVRMGCCAATPKNVKMWGVIMVIDAALFIGAGIYTMTQVGPLKTNINCILDDYSTLVDAINTGSLTAGADAAAAIPTNNLDTINRSMNYLDYGAAIPGVLMGVFLLVALLTALCGIKKGCCRITSKCFVTFGLILNIVALIFFAILVVVSFASQSDQAKAEYASAVSSCSDGATEVNLQLAEAAAALAVAVALGSDTTQLQADYNEAKFQADTYSHMCSCIDDTLSTLEPLDGPGILGIISSILGLVALIGACCAQACCKEPYKIESMA